MKRVIEISFSSAGPVAGDKDLARELRRGSILPALEATSDSKLVLDFLSVAVATQSFIHACIAEPIQRWGQSILERLEFRGCNDEVKEVIATVIAYNIRAHELGRDTSGEPIKSLDIPQADKLSTIRHVLDFMAAGDTYLTDLATSTGYSYRHLHYRLQAARILGLARVSRTIAILTESGFALTNLTTGSNDELEAFTDAIEHSYVLKKIAPNILSSKREPLAATIASRITTLTGLSESTSLRRAKAIISWRREIAARHQQSLPL